MMLQVMGSSSILLALQRDGWLLRRLHHGSVYAPMVTAACWVLWWSSVQTCVWWDANNPLQTLLGFVELSLLLLSLPHYLFLLPVMWLGLHLVPDKVPVFLLPIQFFLLIFANSYWAWLLLLLSISTTVWLSIQPSNQVTGNSVPASVTS